MVFWQLTIDANDPARLARFWAAALGFQTTPPALAPQQTTTWHAHYRDRLGEEAAYDDRLFDPSGEGPALWFQQVPETKAGKNRLHLDLYPTGRDDSLDVEQRAALVEQVVADLERRGGTVLRRTRGDDPDDVFYYVTMQDPEGNEFCVS
jgi:predicted enzyme related to lactoylglutathione lyase